MTHIHHTDSDAMALDAQPDGRHPPLNALQVSRRTLLAGATLLALDLAACGGSDDSSSVANSGGGGSGGGSGGSGSGGGSGGSGGSGNGGSGSSGTGGRVVSTLAGSTSGSANGTGTAALFYNPQGIAVDASGNLYVADTNNHKIRQINIGTGAVTTLAGGGSNGNTSGTANGTGTAALFYYPRGIALDASGNLYVAESVNATIRQIVIATGGVTTVAGSFGTPGTTDGTGTAARFTAPWGLAADASGNLYVADTNNNKIRKINLGTGAVTTLAGGGSNGNTSSFISGVTDGTGTAAGFYFPTGVAVDSSGNNLYVADAFNDRIRQIVIATGVVTTVAGSTNGAADGTGSTAKFNNPYGVAIDASGTLYVADTGNSTIRQIAAGGVVTTLAGAGSSHTGTANGTGTAAQFLQPKAIAVDASGILYVADSGNNLIREIV